MSDDLTRREALLIELVWILSYGGESEMGLTLPEVMKFLDSRVKRREMKTSLELLDEEGHSFLDEVKAYMAKLRSDTSEI